MEIEKITNNRYKFIFANETHTIVHLLQRELLENEFVESAGYTQPHPLETSMTLVVSTKDKNPKEILNYTIDKLVKNISDIEITMKTF